MSASTPAITVEFDVNFTVGRRGRKQMRVGTKPPPAPSGRLPRVTKLMALAVRYDQLLQSGTFANAAELAQAGGITRGRMTQVLNLLHLAPDLQTEILDLPPVQRGRDPITERHLRAVVSLIDWAEQRRIWAQIKNGI